MRGEGSISEEENSIWLRTDLLGWWQGRQWASKGEGGARKQRPTSLSRSQLFFLGALCTPVCPPSSSLWPRSILWIAPVATHNRTETSKNDLEYSLQDRSVWLGKDAQDAVRLVFTCKGQPNPGFFGRCQERSPQNSANLGEDSDLQGWGYSQVKGMALKVGINQPKVSLCQLYLGECGDRHQGSHWGSSFTFYG